MKNQSAQLPFQIPSFVEQERRVDYCIEIINKYRNELPQIRRLSSKFQYQRDIARGEVEYWKEKYQEEKKENDRLNEENNKLKIEIDKLIKTNNRYSIALFDHGNFKHKENKLKKLKGGQKGHKDTNRETFEDYSTYDRKRIYSKICVHCGKTLKRVSATKRKILLDIVINPNILKQIIDSERQWCGRCQKEVNARDCQTLPFTEYGINTFMMVMILKFKCHGSLFSISQVMYLGFGLKLSKSDVSNVLKNASVFLGSKYEDLIKAIRSGEVVFADETGWRVRKQKAWLWIMASEEATVYYAAESRGKGIAENIYGNSQAFFMTDGFVSYKNTIPKNKHLFCWAHILRFSYEETVNDEKNSWACILRDELVRIYHIKKDHPEYSKEKLEEVLRWEFEKLLNLTSTEESFIKIQNRVKEQKEGLILALLETPSGTNNLAERELRPMVLNRHMSYGSDTYNGMKNSAILGSIIQTLSKKEDLLTELKLSLQIGIHEKYSQYAHLTYTDT